MKETKANPPASAAPLPQIAQDAIGRRLRRSFERIIAEPIPDRFLTLLDTLAETEAPGAFDGPEIGDGEASPLPSGVPHPEVAAGKE